MAPYRLNIENALKQIEQVQQIHALINEIYQFEYIQQLTKYSDLTKLQFFSGGNTTSEQRKSLGEKLLSNNDDRLGRAMISKLQNAEFTSGRQMRKIAEQSVERGLFDVYYHDNNLFQFYKGMIREFAWRLASENLAIKEVTYEDEKATGKKITISTLNSILTVIRNQIMNGQDHFAYQLISSSPLLIQQHFQEWMRLYEAKVGQRMLFKSLEAHCHYLWLQGYQKVRQFTPQSKDEQEIE